MRRYALRDNQWETIKNLLPGRQAHDREGADTLLPQMGADTLLADEASDPDERVINPLLAAGKTPVARHLMENF